MKRFFLITAILAGFNLSAQTGPGGVGTSTNNVLWLKADAGTNTTASGGAVSSWADQSGNAIDVSQSTAAQQPSFQQNIINGFPAIHFDNVSVSGQNDKLIGPDSPLLDNTAGYTFFTVSRPQSINCNSIVSKRVDVGVHQSFMLFYYTANRFHVDIQTNNDRFASAATFAPNNNYLIDVVYDGTLPAASRSKIYLGESLNTIAHETSDFVPDNTSPLIIGSTHLTDERAFAGYISEIIIYRQALNKASRIIVNNHLSAKYDIALTANDKYLGDLPSYGDYDFDVAGIGTDTIQPSGAIGSNPSFAASAGKGMGMTQVSGFEAGDYILAGHKTATNTAIASDISGLSGPAPSRWQRVWYVDVTNSGAPTVVNIEFDMSDGGVSPTLGNVSDYYLLYRAGQSGAWTPLTAATAISGDKVQFHSYTLVNDGYYTIGTVDYMISPLPVELISFNAEKSGSDVLLTWTTASEHNSKNFTVEHSTDAQSWKETGRVDAAGESEQNIGYSLVHTSPESGVNYYRLILTDLDGSVSYSEVRAVNIRQEDEVLLFPNPAAESIAITWKDAGEHDFELTDLTGRVLFSARASGSAVIFLDGLQAGKYFVRTGKNVLPFVKM